MKEDLKQAYKLLNLPEDITREELDKRFELLLKRQRFSTTEGSSVSYEEEFRALKFILDTLDQQEINEAENQRFEKWGKLSGLARKRENFFRLYKTHTIISIIVLLVLIFGGNALYKQWQEKKYEASLPPVDISIMFLGNYELLNKNGDSEDLNQAIIAKYPEWKRVETSVVYLPTTGNTEDGGVLDMSYMQRAFAMLAAESPDILIMDEASYEWIGLQDGFQNLETVVSSKTLAPDDQRLKRTLSKESGQEWITGVDITDTKFAEDLPIQSFAMIAGVLTQDENKAKAFDFIEYLIEDMAGQ